MATTVAGKVPTEDQLRLWKEIADKVIGNFLTYTKAEGGDVTGVGFHVWSNLTFLLACTGWTTDELIANVMTHADNAKDAGLYTAGSA